MAILGSPPTYTTKLCEWLVRTMKTINYRNWFSKERITNNDHFCFKRPITSPDHYRLVFTPIILYWLCTTRLLRWVAVFLFQIFHSPLISLHCERQTVDSASNVRLYKLFQVRELRHGRDIQRVNHITSICRSYLSVLTRKHSKASSRECLRARRNSSTRE